MRDGTGIQRLSLGKHLVCFQAPVLRFSKCCGKEKSAGVSPISPISNSSELRSCGGQSDNSSMEVTRSTLCAGVCLKGPSQVFHLVGCPVQACSAAPPGVPHFPARAPAFSSARTPQIKATSSSLTVQRKESRVQTRDITI